MNQFTDRKYWDNYWENYVPLKVNKRLLFDDILDKLPSDKLTSLEIGGFPGTYSIYLKKFKKFQPSLLDFYINEKVLEKMIELNGLNRKDINVIEEDFFKAEANIKYDVVMSFGFIEHFDDTEMVIKKHVDFLNENGILFITLPNLRGLLGKITKRYDPQAYLTHNISSMKIEYLRNILKNLNLKKFEVNYYGSPYLYVNDNAPVGKLTRKSVSGLSALICKLLPPLGLHLNRIFSPNIVIYAEK